MEGTYVDEKLETCGRVYGRARRPGHTREGAAVAIVDLDEPHARTAVQDIEAQGGQAIFIRCDVTRADECQHAVQATRS